jgi:hypothetical protein
MNRHSSRSISWGVSLSLAFILLGFPRSSYAQNTKEVELEVAGPWAYITDPSHSDRIIVISPNVNHLMAVIAGGNANNFNGQLAPGIYTLGLNTAPCAAHHPVMRPKLYDVMTDAVPGAVGKALGAKNARFAVSLPKPCYYESYLESHAKVATSAIDEKTPEGTYTIWMSLHYTVPASTTFATLDATLDSGGTYNQTAILFLNSAWPPSASAISVIAYYGYAGEDYTCDLHSAEHFDAAMLLWGQNGFRRLFPELDATGKQSHRYNYSSAKCPQQKQLGAMDETMITADSLLETINDIRKNLPRRDLQESIEQVTKLQATIVSLWTPQPPTDIQLDLQNSIDLLRRMKQRGERFPEDLTSQFLKVTQIGRAPGRADCHAMQLNIDSTVP